VEYGAHLPLIDFGGPPRTLDALREYARVAASLEYRYLCANDHLLFSRPWLDGPTALAATIEASEGMTLATTVCLPVIRGPVQTAKTLAALDVLSGGRLIAGVGPGSSSRDYAAVGVPFEERWRRFDEAIGAVRAALREEGAHPPIWVASWGSPAGLRRAARRGDGWLASGYNTTPPAFAAGLARLREERALPNGIATMWLYVADRRRDADRMLEDVLSPMLARPVDALRDLALPIGSPEQCAERIAAFRDAGAERIFLWPLADDLRQLERFREEVVPLAQAARSSKSAGSNLSTERRNSLE
jgi:alkanesulfonate monooxygenase SsuD/methylene tetrahydromethanopterin reductase-like flavin-dependent oxidoreductase (luciferase family)